MTVPGAQVHLYSSTGKEWEVVAANSLRTTSIGSTAANKPKYANKTDIQYQKELE